ncbi:MAG: hypothetical protein ACXACH_05150 [Candidatus Hermodarchaeia archaeon]
MTIRLRVVSKASPRQVTTKDGVAHRVVDVRVGDRTGIVTLSLWDDAAHLAQDDEVIDVDNGYVSRFKGQLRLNLGRYGTIELVDDADFPTGEAIEASQRQRRHRRTMRRIKPK